MKEKLFYLSIFILATLALLTVAVFLHSNILMAQGEPIPLPNPVNENHAEPGQNATVLPEVEAWLAQQRALASRSITDFNIVYATAFDVSPLAVIDQTGAKVVTNWSQLLELNSRQAIDVLIIHTSATGWIENEWMAQAYRNGMAIAGINVAPDEIVEIIADHCNINVTASVFEQTEPYYAIYAYSIGVEYEADKALIHHAQLSACVDERDEDIQGLQGGFQMGVFTNGGSLTTEADEAAFITKLVAAGNLKNNIQIATMNSLAASKD